MVKMAMSSESVPHEFRPVVYVAAPFRFPDVFANIRAAIEVGERLEATGIITAWVPHQNALWGLIYPHDADFWLDYDFSQLARSDALFRVSGESPGADDEEAYCRRSDVVIPVFYDEDDVIVWAKGWLDQ